MSEINYSIALRCIGQDLERRGLKVFVIKRDGSHFVVLPSDLKASAIAPDCVRYSPSDIEIIDRCGETARGNQASHEFLHRAQMLRAIGDYLDKYGSTLISITCYDVPHGGSPFRVEYTTREGERVIDDRPGAAIFDECVLMFQKRGQMSRVQGRATRGHPG
jgi:hypothetical protein